MSKKSILIVDDDLSIRECLQVAFEGEGYPVLLAKHGQAALDILMTSSTPKPGLILLDHMMPVMDGPAFLLELQRIHPEISAHTPIFIMTARADIHQLTIKATGLLRKPGDLAVLFGLAARYCAS
jgi:CheY-like chemotaxis protein